MRMVPLDTLCEIQIGRTPSRSVPKYWDGDLPWATISDFAAGRHVVSTKERITQVGASESGAKLIAKGTLLLSFKLSLGKRAFAGCDLYTNEAIAALDVRDPKSTDPRYLYWALGSIDYDRHVDRAAKGKTLNKAKLEALEVPLPDPAEQKRIAAILDAADVLCAKRRKALVELDALVQSVFIDLFGDPVTNPRRWKTGVIGDLLESVTYGTSKKASPESGAYPILRMNNITYTGAWDFSELKYIDLSKKEASKHLVHKGHLLFNRTNSKELVGKTAVYRRAEPMAYAGYLVRGIANSHANPEYIGAFMNMPSTKKYLRNKCKNIIGMANINAKEFAAIPIAKPPVDLQHQFASVIERVESQRQAQREHLVELDALFASIQSRAFKGEL